MYLTVFITSCCQDVLEEWLACQRSWLYLEPIFSSDDINSQLPLEGKRYQTMERTWRKVMKAANDNRQVSYGSGSKPFSLNFPFLGKGYILGL